MAWEAHGRCVPLLACVFHPPLRVRVRACAPFSVDIMLDPVTTPDGITYERSALVEHLRKVGNFDPVTRRALATSALVPNLGLREAINAYLEQNPWAYEGPL